MVGRDEFESSFDSILTLSLLSIEECRQLIGKRADVAPSSPVVGVVTCLSGGIPRELDRYCTQYLVGPSCSVETILTRECQELLEGVSIWVRIAQDVPDDVKQRVNSILQRGSERPAPGPINKGLASLMRDLDQAQKSPSLGRLLSRVTVKLRALALISEHAEWFEQPRILEALKTALFLLHRSPHEADAILDGVHSQ
jgi:hypothetical protein